MRKNDLIKALRAMPGNPNIALLDVQKNYEGDRGEGSSDGCYGRFNVFMMPREWLPSGVRPWIALAFNPVPDELEIDQQFLQTQNHHSDDEVSPMRIQHPANSPAAEEHQDYDPAHHDDSRNAGL